MGKEEFRETTLTPGRETRTPQVQMQNKANRISEYQLSSRKDEKQIIQTLSAIKFNAIQNPNGVYVIA